VRSLQIDFLCSNETFSFVLPSLNHEKTMVNILKAICE